MQVGGLDVIVKKCFCNLSVMSNCGDPTKDYRFLFARQVASKLNADGARLNISVIPFAEHLPSKLKRS